MNFAVETGYERRPSPLKVSVSVSESDGPPETIGRDMFQTKRTLVMRIATDFWSNNAQLSQKIRQAEKMARAYMFKDMLPLIEEIMLVADSSEVRELAHHLKTAMLSGSQENG